MKNLSKVRFYTVDKHRKGKLFGKIINSISYFILKKGVFITFEGLKVQSTQINKLHNFFKKN